MALGVAAHTLSMNAAHTVEAYAADPGDPQFCWKSGCEFQFRGVYCCTHVSVVQPHPVCVALPSGVIPANSDSDAVIPTTETAGHTTGATPSGSSVAVTTSCTGVPGTCVASYVSAAHHTRTK